MNTYTLDIAAALTTRTTLAPGLRGRRRNLPGPRSARRIPLTPAMGLTAARARAEGAAPWSQVGLDMRLGVLQDWARALIAQIKAAKLRGPSQMVAFNSVPASVAAGAPTPALARQKLSNAKWLAYVKALQQTLRAGGIVPVGPDQAVRKTIAQGAARTSAPRTPAAAANANIAALKARVAALRAQGKALRPQISVSQAAAFNATPGTAIDKWNAYIRAWEDALRKRNVEPTINGFGSLGATGFAMRRSCSYEPAQSSSEGSRGTGRGVVGGATSPFSSGAGGPGGPGGRPNTINASALRLAGGSVAQSATAASGDFSGGYGGGFGALVQDTFFATPAAGSSFAPRAFNAFSMQAPTGGDGDDGSSEGGSGMRGLGELGDDEMELGSWLSKAMGKLGIKQIAPTAAAGGALAIPIIGPLISGAIGAVQSVAQSKEATKQAQAAAAAAQAQAQALANQPLPAAEPATKKGAAGQLPAWVLPAAAITGGALILKAVVGRRR